jgi:amino acid adenylation domain-containing protein
MNGTPNLPDGIAVIGMAGRFPKAKNVDEFWQNLRNGVEAISFFSDQELEEAGISFPRNNPNYVKARAVLEDADKFDASFFGINPKEAEIMDPQHRVFLECAWEALEGAGYAADDSGSMTGVFAGMSMNTYLISNLATHPELMELVGSYQTMLANDKDYLPTRVSYKLNLKGPSLNVQTACSTSLVAVCVACQQLLNFQCDLALAGGVSVTFPQKKGHLYQEGAISSPDGHCRAFDARAQGTVAGDATGIVVLKRVAEAIADGDQIYAIIKGFATNNDGSEKIGYTAPSENGQAEAIALAQAVAGVEPDSISYVVTHGTGTPLGDPIEISGLTKAFRAGTERKGFCAVTSVKSSIGHSDAAAGIAGLINAILALYHGEIPPSLHFEQPNPKIDFSNSPFFVNTKLQPWKRTHGPRRAGVSSFGIGGTNAHVVLEEAPQPEGRGQSKPRPQLLVLSAKTASALDTSTTNLTAWLKKTPDTNLADTAFTLQAGRRAFPYRRFVVSQTAEDAVEALQARDSKRVFSGQPSRENAGVAFLFPGQGAQQVNMGLDLYQAEPVFREHVDLCCDLLKPHLGCDLRSILYPSAEGIEGARQRLTHTQFTQPALFVIEYSMAKLLQQWGIQPEAMIGHSIGEYVAACLAGVFSLESALGLVAARGRLMEGLPAGTMLAVRLKEEEVKPLLSSEISLAAINSTSLCVLSGPPIAIDKLRQDLLAKGVVCQALHTSHAFHSSMMEPILGSFLELVRDARPKAPRLPYISNLTGDWIQPAEAVSPEYWAQHLRNTVRFAAGIGTLLKNPDLILLEVGPGQTLTTLARQHPNRTTKHSVLATMRPIQSQQSDLLTALNALGHMWLAGASIHWTALHQNESRRRVKLPTYPFERQRYFVEPARPPVLTERPVGPTPARSIEEPANNIPAPAPDLRAVTQSEKFGPELILAMLSSLFSMLSGLEIGELDAATTFTEMGFDSLFLTQACQGVEKTFGIKIAFGQLLEKFPTLELLTTHVFSNLARDGAPEVTPPFVDNQVVPTPNGTLLVSLRAPAEPVRAPLTEAQKELWYAVQKGDEAATAFNQGNALSLRGSLEIDALRKAIQALVDRHEALRTTFAENGEYQEVQPGLTLEIPLVDLSGLEESDRFAQLDAMFHSESNSAFDLLAGPLCRFRIVKMGEEHHILITTVHHLICDGTSLGVLLAEMSELYEGLRRGIMPQLPPAPGYADYAKMQAEQKDNERWKASEEYWLSQFSTLPPLLDLPTDFPRPAEKSFRGGWVVRTLRPGLCRNLKRMSAQHGCTLFTTMLAGYYIMLYRLTGQNQLVVGIPASERPGEHSERLVGHTVNFLPLRTDLSGDLKFSAWLSTLKRQFFNAFDHLSCTYGTIVQKLNLPRDRSRMPLVSASFNMVWVRSGLLFPGLEVELQPNPHTHANFDLTFNLTETEGLFILDCNYNADLITSQTAERWIAYFEKLLETISQNPDAKIQELAMIPALERQKLLIDWNRSVLDFPKEIGLHQLFEAQVARTPTAPAASSINEVITYCELNSRANQLAHFLRKQGVNAETPVAVLCDRTPEMAVFLLAIWKAGGACVPVDASFSKEEMASLLDHADIQLFLTREPASFSLEGVKTLSSVHERDRIAENPKTNPASPTKSQHLAVIFYNNGLPGKVKGVAHEHRSLVPFICWAKAAFTTEELAGVAVTSTYTQPAWFFEILAPLCSGGRAVFLDTFQQILASPVRDQIRMLNGTPALLRELLHASNLPPGVRTVNVYGNMLSPRSVDFIYERSSARKVNHLFSVPELAGFATCSFRSSGGPATIGRPITNTQVFLLDERMQPVPLGAEGELYIGGEHLARGYHRNETLTSERFVAHPFRKESGARLFRTGDICRYLPDGNLVYLGRMERQTIVNGSRMHPEQIEAVLTEHPAVRHSSVFMQQTTSEPRPLLKALVAPAAGFKLSETELRQFLQSRLPRHLIPEVFLLAPDLPFQRNGKPNYAALPTGDVSPVIPAQPSAPIVLTPLQEKLTRIWCDVIGLPEVGLDENFFDLGGHSVLVTQIVARIRKTLNVNLSLRSIFDFPTIAELSTVIEDFLAGQMDKGDESRRLTNRSELLPKE